MRASFYIPAVVTLMLALGACGDSSEDKAQSAEEKAQTTVCDARAGIASQVDELKGLTAATVTKDGVTESLDAIKKDLDTMASAQAGLSEDRRSEAEAANKAFNSSVETIKSDFLTSVSASDAKTALVTALQQLATSYQTAFEPLNCN